MGTAKLRLVTGPQQQTHTSLDTIEVSKTIVDGWKRPPFQRPVRVNEKVQKLVEELKKNGGVIPGIITIGLLNGEWYLVDGQHRIEAFLLSGIAVAYVDVRYKQCATMAEMSDYFREINGAIAVMRPDDILRSLEFSNAGLALIRKECPFVGYDHVRLGERGAILGMAATLRCWISSAAACPGGGGGSAQKYAEALTVEEAAECVRYLKLCEGAWGRDREYVKLWGALNLTLCAWLYRNTVVSPYSQRSVKLTPDIFKRCLMSLSANTTYLDWLVGRNASERDRSPAYDKIKKTFAGRLEEETGSRGLWPSPSWASSHGRSGG